MAEIISDTENTGPAKTQKPAMFSKQIPIEELFLLQEDIQRKDDSQVKEDIHIQLRILPDDFTVCQISDPADIPFTDEFVFVGKTDDELSLVCLTGSAPSRTAAREDGWKAMKIQGVLDFSLVGILAGIASILAKQKISIFAVSTYNTDYILLKDKSLPAGKIALEENGYIFV